MPNFSYSAAKQGGEVLKGTREAESEKDLALLLKTEGLFLLKANKDDEKGILRSINLNVNAAEILSRIKPIGIVDKMFFTRNLAVMVSAGLALTKALDSLVHETSNVKFKKVIQGVNDAVIKGNSFADALKAHEGVFGILYVNMVEVGETTGKLTLVLKLLANQMKKDHDLKRRVRGAMLYPLIIITALLGIGALMMVYVVPTLSQTVRELGVELPLTTKIIIGLSDFMVHYALWGVLGFFIVVALFWRALRTHRGKSIFDHIILRAPIFGPIVKKFNAARFTRILAYLIASGVPIVRSLEVTSRVLGNTLYRRATEEAAKEIQKGRQLNEILLAYPKIFPPLMIQMIKVGEETGKVSNLLLRIALFFEEDVNETTKNLSTVIEPLLMIVIGIGVGFFAISMLQPIYSSLGSI